MTPTFKTIFVLLGVFALSGSIAIAQVKSKVGGGVDGDQSGAIRALGDAEDDGAGRKPAVKVPKVDLGPSRTGGPPRGTKP